MSKMIQLRHVSDQLHRKLKAKAEEAGLSLSDYLIRIAKEASEKPSIEEMLNRINKRTPIKLGASAASLVRQERSR